MALGFDHSTIYNFLKDTPEKGLRQMFVNKTTFTDVHFGLLMKTVRACTEVQFAEHIEKNDFPKIKFGNAEEKFKETFWKTCIAAFEAKGLIQPAGKQKAA